MLQVGSRKGILPVAYVEILTEPGEGTLPPPTKPAAAPAAHSILKVDLLPVINILYHFEYRSIFVCRMGPYHSHPTCHSMISPSQPWALQAPTPHFPGISINVTRLNLPSTSLIIQLKAWLLYVQWNW